jgi:hypothetical protein
MTPREFLDEVVKPNVAEFHGGYDSVRLAWNAIGAVDALAAHMYLWGQTHASREVTGVADDSHYREDLAQKNQDFRLLRDTAKALKHVRSD